LSNNLSYADLDRPDFPKLVSEKQEAAYLADLAKVSLSLSHWARKRFAEGFTITAVQDCIKVALHREKLNRLKA
jgi:hypothetical protein